MGIMDHGRVLLERSLAFAGQHGKAAGGVPDRMTEVPSAAVLTPANRPHPYLHHADERPGGRGPSGGVRSPAGGRSALTLEEIFIYELGRCGLCSQRHRTLTPRCSART